MMNETENEETQTMIQKRIGGLLLAVLMSGCCGCVSNLDKTLMDMRAQANANERLYAEASLKFVDAADQMATFKHMLQTQILSERNKVWLLEHTTKDGIVQATPEDFAAMLAKRDADAAQLGESKSVWSQVASDYRRMITDKRTFSEVIFAKEVNAQAAKESLQASTDSVIKALSGAVGTAAIALPLLIP
jgi:hypothetical protein